MKSRCWLRSYDQIVAGGYIFAQKFGNNEVKRFPGTLIIEHQAQSVSAWRTNNALPRASFVESLEDVSRYTCYRLGNPPTLCRCVDENGRPFIALNESSAHVRGRCGGCGAPV